MKQYSNKTTDFSENPRVAAYVRIATVANKTYFENLSDAISEYSAKIQAGENWQYAGVYADDTTGIKDAYAEFARMLADARDHKFDKILTESISRFGQSPQSMLETVAELLSLGIGVYFEEQEFDTMSGESEEILAFLSDCVDKEFQAFSERKQELRRAAFARGEGGLVPLFGTGYVGLVTGTCFAEMGNDVRRVDADADKIEKLRRGEMPIYEPGLAAMVAANAEAGRLRFTASLPEAIRDSEICFIAVGTPQGEDGGADLRYVLAAAREIGRTIDKYICVVNKSTVPVGTAGKVRAVIREELDKRGARVEFDVASNPEFLKEGSAVGDCMRPDRVVIGTDNDRSAELLRTVYEPYVRNTGSFLAMDTAGAEMTKYAANAMLATKISFMNEIAGVCERVGADVNKVRLGIGSDSRIGYSFIYPGCGYGGSCFPKDVEALIRTAEGSGFDTTLLKAVTAVNNRQKHVVGDKVKSKFGGDLTGRKFAVWGLAFKPDTDDMRESPAITVINDLVEAGATVAAYDPKAADEARTHYLKDIKRIEYCISKYDALKGADALILVTEWKEFRSPDFYEIKQRLNTPVIFDGRNQYDEKALDKIGIEYHQIGVRKEYAT